jgi:branched-chain amino acid transport system ATP-binding protein
LPRAIRVQTIRPMASADPSLLHVEGVSFHFGGIRALDRVGLTVRPGEIRGLIGPNGAGKTTLLNLVTGIYQPSEGRIVVDGHDITRLRAHKVARLGVSRTFQLVQVFSGLTVLENVLIGLEKTLRSGVIAAALGTARMRAEEARAREHALETLRFLDLLELRDRRAADLSFGQQRLVELARILVGEPKLLLLDEAAAGLDPARAEELLDVILRLRAARGVTIVLVEHAINLVMRVSDRVTVLQDGRTLAEGTPDQVTNDEHVIRAYLGGGRAVAARGAADA